MSYVLSCSEMGGEISQKMRGTVKIELERTDGLAGPGNKHYFFPSCPLTIQQCDWQMMFAFVRSTGKIWNFTLVRCILYFSSK